MTRVPISRPEKAGGLHCRRIARAAFALALLLALVIPNVVAGGDDEPRSADDWLASNACGQSPLVPPIGCAITAHVNLSLFGTCNDDGACPFTIGATTTGTSRLPGAIDAYVWVLMDLHAGAHGGICATDPSGSVTVSTPESCINVCARNTVGTFAACAGRTIMIDRVGPGGCDDVYVGANFDWGEYLAGASVLKDYVVCENLDHTSFILPDGAPYPFPV
ncbi:MAG: hypothetical protein QOE90_2740 [Thermoplasmata archaeon]|jgi:hypothetical protein|nr:hypothetical protein [Thermoplasmata archaeon]